MTESEWAWGVGRDKKKKIKKEVPLCKEKYSWQNGISKGTGMEV